MGERGAGKGFRNAIILFALVEFVVLMALVYLIVRRH